MSVPFAIRLGISLETVCDGHLCNMVSFSLYEQMCSGRYDEMSVMPLPMTIADWRAEHRTARKRADRAAGRFYNTGTLAREAFDEDIYDINMSAGWRQGRPMSRAYTQRQRFSPLPEYPCSRHAIRTTGVWAEDWTTLVGYLVMIRAGELALVSQILGHADHLENEIMYLLFEHALEREIAADPEGLVVYNRHDSGTDGLRFFKERLGFQPMPVEWLP